MQVEEQRGDGRLLVKFYRKAILNNYQTSIQNRPIFDDFDCVKISIPGDDTTEIDTIVNEVHKKRFPYQWEKYKTSQNSTPYQSGTPLSEWGILSEDQIEQLNVIKFRTVESIASASDHQIQRIGMIVGMHPWSLREEAKKFTKIDLSNLFPTQPEASSTSRVQELEALNQKLQNEMESKLASMQEQLEKLLANKKIDHDEESYPKIEKIPKKIDLKMGKKRGRPSKKKLSIDE